MAKRIKKGDPELLLVSFCDIVTITTAAMFMAMIITIQEASKIPSIRVTPRMQDKKSDFKRPVFFECRNNEIFPVDQENIVTKMNAMYKKDDSGTTDQMTWVKKIRGQKLGDAYYIADPVYLLAGQIVLEPREGVHGETVNTLIKSNGVFCSLAAKLNPKSQSVIFLVRDDSFSLFRLARATLTGINKQIDAGWEYLGENERLRFGLGGRVVLTQ